MRFFSFAASLAVLIADVYALFDGQGIETLTTDNWADKVDADKDHAWVVTFYADWCPYCKPFSDEYSKAVSDPALVGKRVKFGAVDVMANRDLIKKFGIKRSPTIKVFGIDKSAPEDYLGHRKQADLVSYCGEYCTKHNFLVPEPKPEPVVEAPKVASYYYNVDAIVKEIASAHQTRVGQAELAHKQKLEQLQVQLGQELDSIKANFNQRLQDLGAERSEALQNAYDAARDAAEGAKGEHAANLQNLDKEAVLTIEDIIDKGKADVELTDYIPSLGKSWFNIEWNYGNRRAKQPQQPASYGQDNYQIGAPSTPSAPVAPQGPSVQAPQSDYYGAPRTPSSPDSYYNSVPAPESPSAPSSLRYPGAPSAPDAVYGYQQQKPSYGGYGGYQQQSYGPQQQYGGYNAGYNAHGNYY